MSVPPIAAVVASVRAQMLEALMGDVTALTEAGPAASSPAARTNPAPQANPTAQAVVTARAAAAGAQASLAPLLANLEEALAAPGLPVPVKAAIGQVLALRTPLTAAITPEILTQATARSGLFLEARLAAQPDNPPPADLKAALLTLRTALEPMAGETAPTGARASNAPPPPPLRDAALAGQAPAAPAPSSDDEVTQIARQPRDETDQVVARQTLQQVASLPDGPDAGALDAPATAAGAKASLAPLLANLEEALAAPGLPAPVKAAIAQVLALRTPLTTTITPEIVNQATARSGPFLEARLVAQPDAAPPPDLKAALLTLQTVLEPIAAEPAPTRTRASKAPPPPPLRDGALAGQKPAAPTLSSDDDVTQIARQLRDETGQAVARQTLHQIASLTDGPDAGAWMFELPFLTPQGAAVAQFAIARDDQTARTPGEAAAWRARFSIDLEPLGPLHVHLSLGGERTAVTIWAERAGSLEALRGLGDELARALPADVAFRPGTPPAPPPTSGQFLDRSS
jgi:hypothetical protein